MKYMQKAKIFKNSTGTNTFNPHTNEAYSYMWWKYCTEYKGKIIFNNSNYSATTNKHQLNTLRLIGYQTPDIFLYNTTCNLEDVESTLRDEIDNLKKEVLRLISKIKAPRTHTSTNKKRKEVITEHLSKIYTIRKILNI